MNRQIDPVDLVISGLRPWLPAAKVTGQTPWVEADADGRPVHGYLVGFEYGEGRQGAVWLSEDEYSGEAVRRRILLWLYVQSKRS